MRLGTSSLLEVPRASAHATLDAVVLSDGTLADAYRTARSVQAFVDRVEIIERLATGSSNRPAGHDGIGLRLAEWSGDSATITASSSADWLLVLAAGERALCLRPDRFRAELDLTDADRLDVGGPTGPTTRFHRLAPSGASTATAAHVELLGPDAIGDGRDLAAICPVCTSTAGFDALPIDPLLELRALGFGHPADGWELIDHERYECRSCRAFDRDRLMWIYVQDRIRHLAGDGVVVEVAPSAALSPRLRSALGGRYETGDLERPDVDRRLDLQALPYDDRSVELLVCSHVLEHVPDDAAAMSEIRRVLTPTGVAVLLVPISLHLAAVEEDPQLTDPVERRARFGQADHVRTYTPDGFIQRLTDAGLRVDTFGASDVGSDLLRQFAIPATGRLYLASRADAP